MRAGLYARVSSKEQAEEGYSIESQLEAMRRFCKDRKWPIAAEYIEPGISGTTDKRPALQEALADCEAGRLDVLITHRLDRFYRNLELQIQTLSKLGCWGVAYVSTTEQIDYSAPQGMLFMQMLGVFNQYYVANLAREAAKGKRGRARKGLTNASKVPYGYMRGEHGVFKPDPEQALILREIFERYATGGLGYNSLVEGLNARGVPPGQKLGGGLSRLCSG